jgi:ATP-binding cassette subfamily F protein uup
MAPLLSAKNITRTFEIEPLFCGLTLAVEPNQRVVIVGKNGCGKSTFLKILAGLDQADDGELSTQRDLRITYVPQIDNFGDDLTAEEVLLKAVPDYVRNAHGRVAEVLTQLGLNDKQQEVQKMSGGERKRLAIARGLITDPELLLLDEPTNHLDIPGIGWLESLLKESKFSSIIISHDRYFIENIAQRVMEIDSAFPNGALIVNGAYSEFLQVRANFIEQLEQYRSNLANKVRREVEWLRQGAKARTTKQKARIDRASDLIAELQGITRVEHNSKLEFGASGRQSKELIKVEDVALSHGDRKLFSNLSFILSPGSRLGIVGPNGCGKTSLLRTILGELMPTKGRVLRASKLKVALLDQMRVGVDRTLTLQKILCGDSDAVVFGGQEYHVAGWARRFLFTAEQLSLSFESLSGGEQARAILARLMRETADVLILDEPTNDLDIPTLEVLEEALLEFPGALILVTHDRYLIDRVCQVIVGLSGYGDSALFADHQQWSRWAASLPRRSTTVIDSGSTSQLSDSSPSRQNRSKAKQTLKLTFTEQHELKGIEKRILQAESELSAFESKLALCGGDTNPQEFQELCAQLSSKQAEVDSLYSRWQYLDEKSRE